MATTPFSKSPKILKVGPLTFKYNKESSDSLPERADYTCKEAPQYAISVFVGDKEITVSGSDYSSGSPRDILKALEADQKIAPAFFKKSGFSPNEWEQIVITYAVEGEPTESMDDLYEAVQKRLIPMVKQATSKYWKGFSVEFDGTDFWV